MRRWPIQVILAVILFCFPLSVLAQEPDTTSPCAMCFPDRPQTGGAIYRICMPILPWNGDLVIFAHGYVAVNEPIAIQEEHMALSPGVSAADFVTGMGYAFATTSFSVNGLAVEEALVDLVDLVDIFATEQGTPERVFVIGVSEGGLITTLAIERRPDLFDAGLALCGPYGSFQAQTNYIADTRALLDYFIPDLLPGSPISVPTTLLDDWDTVWENEVLPEIQSPSNEHLVTQWLTAAGALWEPDTLDNRVNTIERLLWYNAVATNDAADKLGGQPYDNTTTIYSGSDNDTALNAGIARYSADLSAQDTIRERYETSGNLTVPLVTLHNTDDPLVPIWHADRYAAKVWSADQLHLHHDLRVASYGHCTFGALGLINAFNTMIAMANNPPAPQPLMRCYLPLAHMQSP